MTISISYWVPKSNTDQFEEKCTILRNLLVKICFPPNDLRKLSVFFEAMNMYYKCKFSAQTECIDGQVAITVRES